MATNTRSGGLTTTAARLAAQAAGKNPALLTLFQKAPVHRILVATDPSTLAGRNLLMLMTSQEQDVLLKRLSRWKWLSAYWALKPYQIGLLLSCFAMAEVGIFWWVSNPAPWLLGLGALYLVTHAELHALTRRATRRFDPLVKHPEVWLMTAVLAQRSLRAGAYLRIAQRRHDKLLLADALAIEAIAGPLLRNQVDTWAYHTLRGAGDMIFETPLEVRPFRETKPQ